MSAYNQEADYYFPKPTFNRFSKTKTRVANLKTAKKSGNKFVHGEIQARK